MNCLSKASKIRFNNRGKAMEYESWYNETQLRTIFDRYSNPKVKGYNLYYW